MQQQQDNKPENVAGVFIDIDGVVLQGGVPFDFSKEAIHKLWNEQVPFVFVTNGTYSSEVLVKQLTDIFELPFTADHCIVAPSPCSSLTQYHDKNVLVCCQDDAVKLIEELGFSTYMTMPELVEIFPELDYVDHNRRTHIKNNPMSAEERCRKHDSFKPIEAILLLGEPINWECHLQVLIDVLMTNGDPRNKFKFVPSPHLPIIACNRDLTFKGAAHLPRFGHGAFLECLETLYMKITRNQLEYEQMMGKPYLVTYEYSAKQIQKVARPGQQVTKFYIIGDNPDVDIRGANSFKEHLYNLNSRTSRRCSFNEIVLREKKQADGKTSSPVESILVGTGVYNQQADLLFHLRNLFTNEADENNNTLMPPTSYSRYDNETDQFGGVDGKGMRTFSNASGIDCKGLRTFSNASAIQVQQLKEAHASRRASNADLHQRGSQLELSELKQAMSRRNSFISYFDNKLNIPDLHHCNLLEAVDYICQHRHLVPSD